MKKNKVLLITILYAPQRIPIYMELAKKYSLKVIWLKKVLKLKAWEFREEQFNFSYFFGNGFIGYLKSILEIYKFKNKTILFTGYGTLLEFSLILFAIVLRRDIVLWTGIRNKRIYKEKYHRYLIKKFIFKFPKTFITYGTYSTKYLIEVIGIDKKKIFTGMNVGMLESFRKKLNKNQESLKCEGIKVLTVGNLIERKGINIIIDILKEFVEEFEIFNILGQGKEKDNLLAQIKLNGLDEKVFLRGFLSRNEILEYYLNSDIFILPSLEDTFSMASSEAIASGLFCLLSCYDNASIDLLIHGVNGFEIDPLNKKGLKEKLKEALYLARKGFNKKKISYSIGQYSEKFYSNQIINAIEESQKYLIKND